MFVLPADQDPNSKISIIAFKGLTVYSKKYCSDVNQGHTDLLPEFFVWENFLHHQ